MCWLGSVWRCNNDCFSKCFLFENIWKYIFFYFLKFLFNISKSNDLKKSKKINLKQERNFKIFEKHGWAAKTNGPTECFQNYGWDKMQLQPHLNTPFITMTTWHFYKIDKDGAWFYSKSICVSIRTKIVFVIMIIIIFQSLFYLEIHQNNIFFYF